MRLKTTQMRSLRVLRLAELRQRQAPLRTGGGHGRAGTAASRVIFPTHAFGGYLTRSRKFTAPAYAGRSFSYAIGFHQGHFPGRGLHRRIVVVDTTITAVAVC
jgi:hypothetical protein